MKIRFTLLWALAASATLTTAAFAARSPDRDVDTVRTMLADAKQKIRTEFYDPTFTGIPFEQEFARAEQQLATTRSLPRAMAIAAQCVLNLGDSHTRLLLPRGTVQMKYGWWLNIVGQNIHIHAVKPGSDAEKKGILRGERVLEINGMPARRDTLDMILYVLVVLRPSQVVTVKLESETGAVRTVQFAAEVEAGSRNLSLGGSEFLRRYTGEEDRASSQRTRFHEFSPEVILVKYVAFEKDARTAAALDRMARYPHAILDLRGNTGGDQEIMLEMIGACLGRKAVIGHIRSRDKTASLEAASRRTVPGKLYVLVDGQSMSAAEVFARVLQLEQRAIILGDRTAGHVNQSRRFTLLAGDSASAILYGVNVATGSIVMNDGSVLEKKGVEPDVWLVPSTKDLVTGSDRVLATAAKMAGVNITPADAGAIARQLEPPLID